VAQDGTLSNRRLWASFTDRKFDTIVDVIAAGVIVPDGIALDAEGALWIADANRRGPIRVAEGGRILDWCDTGELTVYALALGGVDRRTLYMCAAPPLFTHDPTTERRACLLSARVEVPGAGLP
jgi:sugar lactone lactonase YvrE